MPDRPAASTSTLQRTPPYFFLGRPAEQYRNALARSRRPAVTRGTTTDLTPRATSPAEKQTETEPAVPLRTSIASRRDAARLAHDQGHELDRRRPQLRSTVALVTGGGRGIGRMVAGALAGAGASVGLLARSGVELADVVTLIQDSGGTAEAAIADVTDPGAVAAAVGELQRRLGPIDLLVNNAGILGPIGPVWEVDAQAWWTTLDVNLRGVLLCTQLVLPAMVSRRRGRIINVTSQAGVHRWPLVSGYSVSKAAVTKLSENLAHETRRYGISVFSVHPGLLPIGMSETMAAREPVSDYEHQIRQWADNEFKQGRGADPERAVELILRLAAGDADSLSGRHLSVHDDLDALLARLPEVRDHDLYVLRPDPLPPTADDAGPEFHRAAS
jgi:NAD(P)-dependent dehydrogenase (short-subunit alcohol dehydrogenase family)